MSDATSRSDYGVVAETTLDATSAVLKGVGDQLSTIVRSPEVYSGFNAASEYLAWATLPVALYDAIDHAKQVQSTGGSFNYDLSKSATSYGTGVVVGGLVTALLADGVGATALTGVAAALAFSPVGVAVIGLGAGYLAAHYVYQNLDAINTGNAQGVLDTVDGIKGFVGSLMRAGKSSLESITSAPAYLDAFGDWATGVLSFDENGSVSPLPTWLAPVQNGWNGYLRSSGPPAGCPLVLDLGTTGITLSGVHGPSAVYWDIDKDGYGEASGWVAKDDGLLAIDKNGDGTIGDQGELFGDQTGYSNGFQALSIYDTNHDGNITVADVQFNKLLVWLDANGDAASQASELHTLSSLSITSINLAYTDTYQDAGDGNTIQAASTFTIGGATRSIVDAWFAYDNVNTSYSGTFTLDPRTLFLPDMRGYGNIPALHVAMSLDPALLAMVQDLSTKTFAQLLDPAYDLQGKLAQIMYQWGGTASADPNGPLDIFGQSRFDNRQLQFMQKLMGQEITSPNPWGFNALQSAFRSAMAGVAGDLLLQSGFASLYHNPSYNLAADGFTNPDGSVTGTSIWFNTASYDAISGTANVNNIFILQKGNGSPDADGNIDTINPIADGHLNTIILNGVMPSDVRLWEEYYGALHIQYSATDQAIVVDNNNGTSRLPTYVQQIVFDNGTVWDLTKGLPITDTDVGHYLAGSDLNDTIDGRGGGDYLLGYAGNDILIGGTGQDGLVGGLGDDTYVFRVGDTPTATPDYLTENVGEGTDTIRLTGGILPNDVRMWTSQNVLFIQYSPDDVINVSARVDYATGAGLQDVEKIAFDNGSIWDLTKGLPLTDTDESHYIFGSDLNDAIDGRGGSDQIYGYGGMDFITGGTGQDALVGGVGDDTYVFRVGDSQASAPDYITENSGEGTDTIRLTGGILPDAVSIQASPYGLISIRYSATDTINMWGTQDSPSGATTSPVEKIAFDNGTVWSLTTGLRSDVVYGAGGIGLDVSQADPSFDQLYYLAKNPDVAAAGVDPYQHFMTLGWKEGRDPSPVFSTSKYLDGNPDVRAAGINPLVSYLQTGAAEGRATYPVLPVSSNYAFTNASTNTSGNATGDTYTGPVNYLQSQYLWSGPGSDNVAISTAIPNVFLKGGAGGDALAVRGGSNVLDGGGGSNFLVGGNGADKGADTFFVDSRGGVVTWSTIVNFHPGDMATIFGFRAGVSTKPYTASDGAVGYTGVTIHSEIDGPGTGIKASMTFAGIDQATAEAHFVTTYGVLPGNIDYMLVQYQ